VHGHRCDLQTPSSINLRQLERDTSTAPPPGQPATVPVVRVTRVSGGAFDWLDAGIGAGLTAALLLGAAGVASLRRRPTLPAHQQRANSRHEATVDHPRYAGAMRSSGARPVRICGSGVQMIDPRTAVNDSASTAPSPPRRSSKAGVSR
jgi:hypothetical protein